MWKLYRRRHLWLFQVYHLFSALYGSFKEDGTSLSQPLPQAHGNYLAPEVTLSFNLHLL